MKFYSTIIPYLLLVSFYTSNFQAFPSEKVNAINTSSFNGVAVPLIDAYNSNPFQENDYVEALRRFKENSTKHIWPWIFLNRIYGFAPDGRSLSDTAPDQVYFRQIRGMDIYDDKGALSDFKKIWQTSLRFAKELKAPGILIDLEAYNNYKLYDLAYTAKMLGKSEAEVSQRLKQLGEELIDLAAVEYPEAILWFTFTRLLLYEDKIKSITERRYKSVSYIIIGMLERIKKKNYSIKIITGGMNSLGYCFLSLQELKEKINQRAKSYQEFTKYYPNFILGGTIALWHDKTQKRGFFARGKCGKSPFSTLDDFAPLMKELACHYRYIYIYAAKGAGYDPYNPDISLKYNSLIRKSFICNN